MSMLPDEAEVRKIAVTPLECEVACLQCGDNLKGLAPTGKCPECGQAVGESLKTRWLRDANPRWLERVYLGVLVLEGVFAVTALLACLKCWGAGLLHMHSFMENRHSFVSLMVSHLLSLALLPGVWLVTLREPQMRKASRWNLRFLFRASFMVYVGGKILWVLMILSHIHPGGLVVFTMYGCVMLAIFFATFIIGLLFFYHQARHMPHTGLTRHAWYFVLLMVPLILTMIVLGELIKWTGLFGDAPIRWVMLVFMPHGYMVVYILILIMLERYRRGMKTALGAAREKMAGGSDATF